VSLKKQTDMEMWEEKGGCNICEKGETLLSHFNIK
jgi:hypothetical protein